MKAILVIDMPKKCVECSLANRDSIVEYCKITGNEIQIIYSSNEEDEIIRNYDCPLKPVHSLKSGGKDYIIYERQFLYDNLDIEIEMMKKGKEIYESNISNRCTCK